VARRRTSCSSTASTSTCSSTGWGGRVLPGKAGAALGNAIDLVRATALFQGELSVTLQMRRGARRSGRADQAREGERMNVVTLSFVDWIIIVLLLVFIVGIGLYLRRFTKSGEDFFLAGRRNSSWVAGMALPLGQPWGRWRSSAGPAGHEVRDVRSHFYWVGAIPAMLFHSGCT
jgi:hypothetical protein